MVTRCASAPLCAPATRTVSTPASYDADRLVRHDPRALLYAPLRVLVHSDDDGNAVFSIDQPSTAFGSLGIEGKRRSAAAWTARWPPCCASSGLTRPTLSTRRQTNPVEPPGPHRIRCRDCYLLSMAMRCASAPLCAPATRTVSTPASYDAEIASLVTCAGSLNDRRKDP